MVRLAPRVNAIPAPLAARLTTSTLATWLVRPAYAETDMAPVPAARCFWKCGDAQLGAGSVLSHGCYRPSENVDIYATTSIRAADPRNQTRIRDVPAHEPGRPLPSRYYDEWRAPFFDRVVSSTSPGAAILDIGAGRSPSIPVNLRPEASRYVGLDVSLTELRKAPPGSYDEVVAGDVHTRMPHLEGRFDLVVSWEVFEHLRNLVEVVRNLRSYLRPGGTLVAHLAGRFSAFAVLNRLLPLRMSVAGMNYLLARPAESVFPAHYDRCFYGALAGVFRSWEAVEILAFYRGAEYFHFSPLLQRAYLRYENWAFERAHRNLATHYLIRACARKDGCG